MRTHLDIISSSVIPVDRTPDPFRPNRVRDSDQHRIPGLDVFVSFTVKTSEKGVKQKEPSLTLNAPSSPVRVLTHSEATHDSSVCRCDLPLSVPLLIIIVVCVQIKNGTWSVTKFTK